MDTLISLIQTLNSMSPLAVIALLAFIIYTLTTKSSKKDVQTISDNHLSGLPDMAETLRSMDSKLTTIVQDTSYIKGRLK